ncbi:single-stranded-DNA-specific exonuclease RecJ [Spirochaeta isovalerica]|uniref:Single-stranded-DNA-specific exonuclease RecJ n=1 Tax=Spirochaeta isovalerica TaxID=150 RepID=A0A841RAZ6_9SPIO|nr:single-stranded-DNA-specific exonuclease RecJ [Spirochaeta isovalerica]MBB6482564.1 single-stranded-DNA-specific exonuclease [Spirochaeta isovalerica]
MIWNKKDIDSVKVREIASLFDIDLLTASIFARRGITEPEQFRFFLEKDFRFLHNPFRLESMEETVDRILLAVSEEEKVMVFGDRDVDGITSTVIMTQMLRSLGLDTRWAVPVGEDDYGLSIAAVEDFAADNGTLIITVDCGISAYDEIRRAVELGIDVLVLDHHNPRDGEDLPPAFAIVNPKRDDDNYPFQGLAGCGIAVKTVWSLCMAKTDLYNQRYTMINVSRKGESLRFEAVKIENLMIVRRLDVDPRAEGSYEKIVDFLSGEALFVFDSPGQLRILREELFGNSVDISLYDLKPEMMALFPGLNGESLDSLSRRSRFARYQEGDDTPGLVLANLFISYLLKKNEALFQPFAKSLDLAALGTIADLMPLLDENRILVAKGVELLNRTERPGLQELLLKLDQRGRKIRTGDISWQITPVINSAGRMGEADLAVRLFLSEDPEEIHTLSDKMIELNKKRRTLGEEAWIRVFARAPEVLEKYKKRLIILVDEEIPRGITGILASRLSQAFRVPAVVLTSRGGTVTGSMRSLPGISVNDFLQSLSGLFLDYGGHDLAAGFSLKAENLDRLLDEAVKKLDQLDSRKSSEESIDVDAELPSDYMTPDLEKILDVFEPYGEKHRPLVFMSKKVKIADVNIIGKTGDHLRLLIDSGEFKWPAVFWNGAEHYGKLFEKNDTVDIVYHINRNFFQSRETLQLSILDLKK